MSRWWRCGPGSTRCRRTGPSSSARSSATSKGGGSRDRPFRRTTAWEPGRRLAYRSSVDDTEVDVRFEAAGGGTLVRVEHSVLPGGDADKAAFFWRNTPHWLVPWCRVRLTAPPPRRLGRPAVALSYQDPPAAARWLAEAFGLRSWDRIPAEGERPWWIELYVGDAAVLLFEAGGERLAGDGTTVWVYVDDLDAHHAHPAARGATIIEGVSQHGFRSYVAADLDEHRWCFVQASPAMRAGTSSAGRGGA